MKDEKGHLNLDLDRPRGPHPGQKEAAEIPSVTHQPADRVGKAPTSRYNWRNIILITGGVLLFFWMVASSDDTGTTPVPAGSNTVVTGDYRCSTYNYDRAVALEPNPSSVQIKAQSDAIDIRSAELDRLRNEIDRSYVNEYSSQYEIDQYNAKVDSYNLKLNAWKRDATSFNSRLDTFNAQVEAHNNFLRTNCTPNR